MSYDQKFYFLSPLFDTYSQGMIWSIHKLYELFYKNLIRMLKYHDWYFFF